MKPLADGFCVVTASTDLDRSRACRWSWEARATYRFPVYTFLNGPAAVGAQEYMGTVPAFSEALNRALMAGHQIICALHDDVLIEQDGWDHEVINHFERHPKCGLAGFLGGTGLGSDDLYKVPYSPHQLARQGVVSNLRDAEAHGARTYVATRVAVLDGLSQIGTRDFWQGRTRTSNTKQITTPNLFAQMAYWGMVHHFQDGALGCFAARLGWETWMLPVAVHHFGGQTAVGDAGYATWAKTILPEGDQDFWQMSHDICAREFVDVLPLRVK